MKSDIYTVDSLISARRFDLLSNDELFGKLSELAAIGFDCLTDEEETLKVRLLTELRNRK